MLEKEIAIKAQNEDQLCLVKALSLTVNDLLRGPCHIARFGSL